jgi:membrane protease YdiL (CAAX protease family)
VADLNPAFPAPAGGPEIRVLVAGFVLLAVGLAALTLRRAPGAPLRSVASTRRALGYALVYGLCTACFGRIIGPALLGSTRSPWLYALGDVMFVTLALFIWVMLLAEDLRPSALGFRGAAPLRMGLALVLGLASSFVYASTALWSVLATPWHPGHDLLVFGTLAAVLGSALPEEILFRGYLMGSLDGRVRRWARVALPALAFTAVRAARTLPGTDMSMGGWFFYVLGTVLPLGLWWGVVRDLAGGSLWPSLVSNAALQFLLVMAGARGH